MPTQSNRREFPAVHEHTRLFYIILLCSALFIVIIVCAIIENKLDIMSMETMANSYVVSVHALQCSYITLNCIILYPWIHYILSVH